MGRPCARDAACWCSASARPPTARAYASAAGRGGGQLRHLQPAAAVDWMVGENLVEPLQKLEFLRRFLPRPVIRAAARNPEQRALPAYGQPRLRRDHRPPLSTREMAGCPARKSHSTCSCLIFRCRWSITFCASSAAGALLPTRKQLARTLHQLLLPTADHRRVNPKLRRQLSQSLLPRKRRHRHSRLGFWLCCFLFMPTSHAPFGPVSLQLIPPVQKSGPAAVVRGDCYSGCTCCLSLHTPDRRAMFVVSTSLLAPFAHNRDCCGAGPEG
jgi:hypothetical protein